MLRFARALGFMAPLAVALCAALVAAQMIGLEQADRGTLLALVGLAAVAGVMTMALLAWSYVGWRLNRIARALETTLEADTPIHLKEAGIPAERRLARAFNAAAGAFLRVEAQASHDRLTGVINRETLLSVLVAEVERAGRHHKPLAVAFIDIDRFKPINDTYGHNSGDAVLRQMAAMISDSIRLTDVFGRYGGEEFMLIMPETTPDEGIILAEHLRASIMAEPMIIAGDQRLQVTISVGIAGGRGARLQVDTLVDQADAAMYAAKSLGRNRTYLFRDLDEAAPVRKAPISAESRAAAAAIGQWANDTATQALASVLAPQPHHRGRPSDMIASLATGMALELGLPQEEIERVRIASLLHDLGKLAVPAEILDKPTALTDGEWQAVGEHPRIGQVILEQASSLREAIPVVLHHHERYNGGGYPHGLKGNEIPLGARIVAVADAYHAMVHQRPYSDAKTHADALAELQRHAGTQFDPDVVNVFCALYADQVPPDGLDEVYRLHERARGGLERIDPQTAMAILEGRGSQKEPVKARRRRSRRTGYPEEAAG